MPVVTVSGGDSKPPKKFVLGQQVYTQAQIVGKLNAMVRAGQLRSDVRVLPRGPANIIIYPDEATEASDSKRKASPRATTMPISQFLRQYAAKGARRGATALGRVVEQFDIIVISASGKATGRKRVVSKSKAKAQKIKSKRGGSKKKTAASKKKKAPKRKSGGKRKGKRASKKKAKSKKASRR